MQKHLKQILLFLMKDGSRKTYSVPSGLTLEEAHRNIVVSDEINKNDIENVLYFPSTFYDLEDIQYYYDEETRKVDEKSVAINFKIEEFRRHRSRIFRVLDMEFMKSLEKKDCDGCSDKIIKLKEHLRGLPDSLKSYLKELEIEEITKFNAFNNVYDLVIINGGSGYASPPTVNISPPDGEGMAGMRMEAMALINEEGSVAELKVTKVGSGYRTTPSVSISKPEGGGNTAIAIASSPENNIFNM